MALGQKGDIYSREKRNFEISYPNNYKQQSIKPSRDDLIDKIRKREIE